MRTVIRLAPLVGLAIWAAPQPAAAQPADIGPAVAAARVMLARYPGTVTLNPDLVSPVEAPPALATGRTRDRARTDALARALGAKVADYGGTLTCPTGPKSCHLSGAAVYLSLSETEMRGDTARVSVTAVFLTGSKRVPVGYETARFTLVRTGEGWKVVAEEELGIS